VKNVFIGAEKSCPDARGTKDGLNVVVCRHRREKRKRRRGKEKSREGQPWSFRFVKLKKNRAEKARRRWPEKRPISGEDSRDSTRPWDRFEGGRGNRPIRAARDLPRRAVLCFHTSICSSSPTQLSRPAREIASPDGSYSLPDRRAYHRLSSTLATPSPTRK
jgi:hypothetical protein